MTYNIDETFRRYHRLLEREPDFFLKHNCSIVKLAEKLKLNRTYASQFVNRDLKTTFRKLVREARLRKMESLLVQNPDKDINELISEAGFSCDLTFRRAYMEKYGELPSKSRYRLKLDNPSK